MLIDLASAVICRVLFCALLAVASTPAVAGKPFDPASFGLNITNALINPDYTGQSQAQLEREVSRIMHDAHMTGAKTVRWFVDDVWPQYPCGKDPENQATGELYPAWFKISAALLRAAQKEAIKVDVVLVNPLSLVAPGEGELQKLGEYASSQGCAASFRKGYYGVASQQQFYEDPEIIHRLGDRFVTMARHLVQFPALGGLEFFNEPDFCETQRVQFSSTAKTLRHRLLDEIPALRHLPLYSGIAWWEPAIARAAQASGDLAEEPFVALHTYDNYHFGRNSGLHSAITWIGTFLPNKPLIVMEAGSKVSISDPVEHARMVDSLISILKADHVAIWPWGTWNDPNDLMWQFNVTGFGGGVYRKILIDTTTEAYYAEPRQMNFWPAGHGAPPINTSVQITHESGPRQSMVNGDNYERWLMTIGTEVYQSVAKDGFLRRIDADLVKRMNTAAPTIGVGRASPQQNWVSVTPTASGWRLDVFSCDYFATSTPSTTPLYVLDYANAVGRSDFLTCGRSWLVQTGDILRRTK